MHTLEKLLKFNTDRMLDRQGFDLTVASLNILEELLEAHGVHDNDDRELSRMLYGNLLHITNAVIAYKPHMFKKPTEHNIIDAFCDIQAYAFGEPLKMGYDPEQCLFETATEISSRVGEIKKGKFVKDKSPEAQKNWYKADFNKAKYEF